MVLLQNHKIDTKICLFIRMPQERTAPIQEMPTTTRKEQLKRQRRAKARDVERRRRAAEKWRLSTLPPLTMEELMREDEEAMSWEERHEDDYVDELESLF